MYNTQFTLYVKSLLIFFCRAPEILIQIFEKKNGNILLFTYYVHASQGITDYLFTYLFIYLFIN